MFLGLIIRKFIQLVTTVILVSILSFFLSKMVPGDQAQAVAELQGNSYTDDNIENFNSEYQRLYKELGLDLPLFYFSLKPSYYPDKFPDNYNFQKTQLANSLLRKKISWNNVSQYIDQLSEISAKAKGNQDLESALNFLWLDNDISRVRDMATTSEIPGWQSFLEQYRIMNDEKVGIYFPGFVWNGVKNQYHQWLIKAIQFDFGISIIDGRSVNDKIISALLWTLFLVLISLILSLVIGVLLSIMIVLSQKKWLDHAISWSMYALFSVPVFWLSTLLIVFFTTPEYGAWTDIFPNQVFRINPGSESLWSQLMDNAHMIILPVICLTLSSVPVVVRLATASLRSEWTSPYVLALKSRGFEDNYILRNHVLKNAMIPIITLVTNSLPVAFAGSLIVEYIFTIPGMGRLMYESLFSSDWNVCFAILLLIGVLTSVILMLSDFFYKWMIPKMRMTDA